MAHLWQLGYAPEDIIGNIFKVAKNLEIKEPLKLELIQVSSIILFCEDNFLNFEQHNWLLQAIGMTHLRIVEGVNSLLQLSGLLAKLCQLSASQQNLQSELL